MKITVDVDIFDDPEYCTLDKHSATKSCPYYYANECELFRGINGAMVDLYSDSNTTVIKCDECKQLFQKAKHMGDFD